MMKSKPIRYIVFPLAILVVLWFVARLTGVFQYYTTSTGSMQPALVPGDHLFSTNLKKARRNDIIVFKRISGEKEGVEPGIMQTYVSRLIAREGETLEIKNGLAYVNGQLVDDSTSLYFPFEFEGKEIETVRTALKLEEDDPDNPRLIRLNPERSMVTASLQELLPLKNTISFSRMPAPEMQELYGAGEKNQTIDNYGPLLIPPGHFFYLGDNRHQSLDARFTGPLPLKNIKGVVF